MLDDNKHIDSLFADGLKNLSVQPNPKVWDKLSGQLGAKKKKRQLIVIIFAAMAASLLLVFTLSNYELIQNKPQGLELSLAKENTSILPKTENTELLGNESHEQIVTKKDVPSVSLVSENNTKQDGQNLIAKDDSGHSLEKWMPHIQAKPQTVASISNFELKLPDELATNKFTIRDEPILLLTDKMKIQNNLLRMEQLKAITDAGNKWSLIGQVSSAYSNEKSRNDNVRGMWSVGGGVKVNYSVGKKLALQTGVLYNQFGQDFGPKRGGDMLYSNDFAFSAGVNSRDETIIVPTENSAGPISIASESGSVGNLLKDRTMANVSSDLSQNFEVIEVPFLLRYNLSQRKLGIFISGGLSANWIIDNAVYEHSNGKNKIGEISGLRTTNFSSQFGLGFEYRLSSKFQIGMEPSFKYYINSINKSSRYNYKPYSIGVFTGVRYSF